MDLLLVPYWADTELGLMQWPPFLLASKVCSAYSSFFFFLTSVVEKCIWIYDHDVLLLFV